MISTWNIFFAIATAILLFSFSSCSKKIPFQTSAVVPAATGTVALKKDNNDNYQIKISLADLAAPSRLEPPKNTYVVWMQTENDGIKNIGQIQVSSNLKASVEAVSSSKPIKIFITAEDDSAIQNPDKQVVLTTKDF